MKRTISRTTLATVNTVTARTEESSLLFGDKVSALINYCFALLSSPERVAKSPLKEDSPLTLRPAILRSHYRWFRLVPVFLVFVILTTPRLSTTFSLKASSSTNHIHTSSPFGRRAFTHLASTTQRQQQQQQQPSSEQQEVTHNHHSHDKDHPHQSSLPTTTSRIGIAQLPPVVEPAPSPSTPNSQDTSSNKQHKKQNKSTNEKTNCNEEFTSKTNADDDEEEEMQTPDDQKFRERILSSLQTVTQWDASSELLQECRSQIPWQDLKNRTGPYSNWEEDRWWVDHPDALFLQRLCRWFQKFMTWVNTPPCAVCGHKDCEMKTVRGPETDEEREGQAKRVEVYYCPECDANTTTFPRYNLAEKLLETQKGRCGEYSNLFGLFCRAAGFETRLVLDLSDHLWTEVRMGETWIMADSCEGVINKASMYEDGWGKKGLCYMIAIAKDHVIDVTPRYTRKFLSDDFQTRRRTHTTSENATSYILQQITQDLQQNLTQNARDELDRRRQLEETELQLYKQSTDWTQQEKYGHGRISGSLAWKQSRSEAGKANNVSGKKGQGKEGRHVASFEVESFLPPVSASPTTATLLVKPQPTSRHDGIVISGTACAIGESDAISVVVVDEACMFCILQTRSFFSWTEAKEFVHELPTNRIVLMNGKCKNNKTKTISMSRLGGWKANSALDEGVAFIGQVDTHPDWSYFSTLKDCPENGYEVKLEINFTDPNLKLRTERYTLPKKVAGRLPENVMPLKTQVMATDEQKRLAFLSFVKSTPNRYSGYASKADSPIYLLDSTSYPFSKMESTTLDVVTKDKAWNTFHFLPAPLVSEGDNGISASTTTADVPKYMVPLELSFFNNSLGTQLLKNSTTRLPTGEALHNIRLVGLYFSAHWCGPCRSFTPMLAEMYEHLKDHRPTHGLEIVFVSSDRDQQSYNQYFASMPWQAIPFENLQFVKQRLNTTYGVRGIPSFVVLDAVSGQVVVSANESRQAVAMACRGGEQQIEAMLDSWLQRTPQESKEILSMLELSCQEATDETSSVDQAPNSYLCASEPYVDKPIDAAARIKELFEELVAGGGDPTSSAANAIGMVAEEQKSGRKLQPGSFNGASIEAGVPLLSEPLDEALAWCSERNSTNDVVGVLKTASKYLKNAKKEPWSSKFRSFKLSNKIADQVSRVEGGLGLLQGLGFEVYSTNQDFRAMIPLSTDLEHMELKITDLLTALE